MFKGVDFLHTQPIYQHLTKYIYRINKGLKK